MPEPITPLGCTHPDVDALLRAPAGAREDASSVRAVQPEEPDDHATETLHGVGTVLDGAHTVGAALEILGVSGAIGTASTIAGPVLFLGGLAIRLEVGMREADLTNRGFHDEILRGAIAALEGRMDDPDVQARIATSPGFGTGARAIERMAQSDPSGALERLSDAVKASKRGGMLAVAEGQDRGEIFDRRMEQDLAFRHGVHFMRRLRGRDSRAFEAQSHRMVELAAQVDRGRCSAPISP